jgi:drug/metabolite transporter (DMT)-like permease
MQISDNTRGAIYMMISMAAFTLNDTAMKAVTQTLPLFQSIALRGLFSVVALVILGLAMRSLRFTLPREDRVPVLVRCLAEIGGTVLFLGALIHMPIANLSAILQFLPLAVALAAAVVFRERIGWRRLSAILIGFIGVLIIIRPGPDGFSIWSVMGLGSVLCVVVRDLATRQLSRATPSVTVAVWAAATVAATGAIVATWEGWQPVSAHQGLLISASASMLIVGYMFSIMVMRVGEIGFIAPFRYTALIWAIMLGWVVFGDFPDGWTLLGSAIVVGTGVFTILREARLKSAKA